MPPSNISISSKSPNQLHVTWIANCDSVAECPHNRIPQNYTISYKSTDTNGDVFDYVLGNPPQILPDTFITLKKDVQANTQYGVSVMTNIPNSYKNNDYKVINSDFSQAATGYTCELFLFCLLTKETKLQLYW